MKIIAHRALLEGPDVTKENTIGNIEYCLKTDFDIEIDIRYDDNHLFKIGHDSTVGHEVVESFYVNKNRLWLHTKDIRTFEYLRENDVHNELNYFYHTNEDFILTSKGIIWAYPGKVVKNSVWLFPERELDKLNYTSMKERLKTHTAICTDYPLLMKHIIES